LNVLLLHSIASSSSTVQHLEILTTTLALVGQSYIIHSLCTYKKTNGFSTVFASYTAIICIYVSELHCSS